MRVLNQNNGNVIPEVERKASFIGKMVGLRFRREGRAFFEFGRPTRAPMDMALVFGPLDIAFLDEDMRVLEIHGALPLTVDPATWRTYRPSSEYKYALEVEKGLLKERGFSEGDSIKIV